MWRIRLALVLKIYLAGILIRPGTSADERLHEDTQRGCDNSQETSPNHFRSFGKNCCGRSPFSTSGRATKTMCQAALHASAVRLPLSHSQVQTDRPSSPFGGNMW